MNISYSFRGRRRDKCCIICNTLKSREDAEEFKD